MRKTVLVQAVACALVSGIAHAAVKVEDKTFNTAANMLAYTEFELSGEPLAEALGLDLDVLDANRADEPTPFDFAAGIESYEYSEEAMYALNYQSGMGPHLVNGPQNLARGGTMADLGKRVMAMAEAVGFPADEIPQGMYPLSLPYASANPEFAEAVNTTPVNGDQITIKTAKGVEKTVKIQVPAYFRDYTTLRWSGSDNLLVPAAVGGILLKEVMWSQDFLGGMHVAESDEEVEAASATMDQDGKHKLGVSAADGFNGMMLTEQSIDKLTIMQNQLGFDGKQLGAKITPQYDPAKGIIYFPHQVKVTETRNNDAGAIGKLDVVDGSAQLRDAWMMLWPLSEFYAFSDQRTANTNQNPAFHAVFDGEPFAATPKANQSNDLGKAVAGSDAFSLALNLSSFTFKNLTALHFDGKAGTLVDSWLAGKQGKHVTTFDAAYALVALQIFQRAQDALPVGYAAGDNGELNLKTRQGQQALELIRKQADFILANLKGHNGLVHDGLTLGGKVDKAQSVDAQFAAIRGLTAAFLATSDAKYRTAARELFIAADKAYFSAKAGTWLAGKKGEYTPWTQAAISGALRSAMLNLRNEGAEKEPELELAKLTGQYVSWFRGTVNGGMQMAEWVGDSGENVIEGAGGDTDEDGVPQVTAAGGKHGTAMVMAAKAVVSE
ncbi:hypothetical protein LA366_05030 [Aeromonas jandaei]|uniref:DUF4856 domain-containing protein n=1 Tax=Aeromonas jandaei TaxID=650 RepID=A0A7T4A9G2_AERJA|nr:hypothetical protein [Aeromonas jandaei]QQB19770.1 hypothetical protein I6H43_20110 [Aeromonas jandaei]UCA34450.1 hypothetical protein LA366_05030 [Aeromonas jandaei]